MADIEALKRQFIDVASLADDEAALSSATRELIEHTTTAAEIAQVPYEIGNWAPSWRQVDKRVAAACERIAAAALARDPNNEAALWLYAQEDFRARTRVARAPIPAPTPEASIAKIERIVQLIDEGVVHPLSIPSLETVPIESPHVLEAVFRELEKARSRHARSELVGALGRTCIDHARVGERLGELLDADPSLADAVSMAIRYGLKKRGVGALDALVRVAERLVSELTASESCDYRHLWPIRAGLLLLSQAKGAPRERALAFFGRLMTELEHMPGWKRERFAEFSWSEVRAASTKGTRRSDSGRRTPRGTR